VYELETNRRAWRACRRGRLKRLRLDRNHPYLNGDLDITGNAAAFTHVHCPSNGDTIAESYPQPFTNTPSNAHACAHLETSAAAYGIASALAVFAALEDGRWNKGSSLAARDRLALRPAFGGEQIALRMAR
jgi:hypothetical protein